MPKSAKNPESTEILIKIENADPGITFDLEKGQKKNSTRIDFYRKSNVTICLFHPYQILACRLLRCLLMRDT